MCAVVVVEVSAVGVVKTVVSQALCVAKTLEDGVHKTLLRERQRRRNILIIKHFNELIT